MNIRSLTRRIQIYHRNGLEQSENGNPLAINGNIVKTFAQKLKLGKINMMPKQD